MGGDLFLLRAKTNSGNPAQAWLSTPANMWFVFCRRPVTNTMIPCARMNSTNQQNEMKWMERAAPVVPKESPSAQRRRYEPRREPRTRT
jgi:hypothetical protein